MKSILSTLVALSILTNLAACQVTSKERAFRDSIPDIPMNRELHFWKPTTSFVVGRPISLNLEKSSRNWIGVPTQSGILLLVFEGGEWITVRNLASYYYPPDGEVGVPPRGTEGPPMTTIGVVPELPGGDEVVYVRVVVLGRIYNGETATDQRTGAFMDVAMQR